MKILFISIIFSTLLASTSFAQTACLTDQYDRSFFDRLKDNNFRPRESIRDNTLALMLADCLGHPDPALRDGIAYEGITAMLRRGRVNNSGIRRLLHKCEAFIKGDDDNNGFLKPFAALCIAEVARTDRINPHFSEEERARIVSLASEYLQSIEDYRGFDEVEGWRHGVAHSADILMQLSLNEHIGAQLHRDMLGAVASQIAPKDHFYIYGEPARLARPLLFIAMQGTIGEQEWTNWFDDIAKPGPELENWEQAFSSLTGLAKRHNLTAFLSALHMNVVENDNQNIKMILPGLNAALQELP